MAGSTFPLRFRTERLRQLVREVAEREGISQNELLEQAAEHEVVARGALLADDLESSATRLRSATVGVYDELVARSLQAFAHGESSPEPLRPRRITRRPEGSPAQPNPIGAVDAFRRST